MAGKIQLQQILNQPYELQLFIKEVLRPIFASKLDVYKNAIPQNNFTQTEQKLIQRATCYAELQLEDGTQLQCYEIILQPKVRIEHSKVSIQQYVRKLLTSGQAMLVNFIHPDNNALWRLSLVARDSKIVDDIIEEQTTHAKRYTYLLGPSETCRTAAERFVDLSAEPSIDMDLLVKTFSVEKLSDLFFDEYKFHYDKFIEYLNKSNFRKSIFNGDDKAIRDFVKKLLGRIVFLCFVQKKGWLGASTDEYQDGNNDFLMNLFQTSGGNENFYHIWLSKLFFETLNQKRNKDSFTLPDGSEVKIPYLNGGLFEHEDFDEHLLLFKPSLFHNKKDTETPNERGFLDFLNAFNFTIYEDSPDDHTIAVDPEMLGHIFENLLEDNKDKGAYYTPKAIVHYMCQESLIEYLFTNLNPDSAAAFVEAGKSQTTAFNDVKKQLAITEKLSVVKVERSEIEKFIRYSTLTDTLKNKAADINKLLDKVKICDPAIGSGAFPMGLLHEIYHAKQILTSHLQQPFDGAEVKLNIIQNSIYGVDIEKGAVDIARLRFWLSLIVDEDIPRPLPNLDFKIVTGNSLVTKFGHEVIEIDWCVKNDGTASTKQFLADIKKLLSSLVDKQKQYFDADYKNKPQLHLEIRNLKIDLLISQLQLNKTRYASANPIPNSVFPSKQEIEKEAEIRIRLAGFTKLIDQLKAIRKNQKIKFEFFDWKLNFPEVLNEELVGDNIGFDIVIANPPYIDSETMVNTGFEEIRNFLAKKLSFAKGNWDIYIAFFEIGFNLTNRGGNLMYISPDKWISKPFGTELRKGLLENFSAIAEAGRKVFKNAKVDSIITLITKKETIKLKNIEV